MHEENTSACLSSLSNCVNNPFFGSNNAVDKTEIHSLVKPPASIPTKAEIRNYSRKILNNINKFSTFFPPI